MGQHTQDQGYPGLCSTNMINQNAKSNVFLACLPDLENISSYTPQQKNRGPCAH